MTNVQRQVASRPWPGGNRERGALRRTLVNEIARFGEQALILAQAELARSRVSETSLWGKAAGDARLHPGVQVEVRDVAAPVAGRYVITEAIHTLDFENGYITEISSLPPEIQSRPRSDIATLGKVTALDDPLGLGRVRVILPVYNRVETGWLPVVLPGGGRKKGFVSLPDIDDSVLVVLLRENPAEGLVLGGLFGNERPPDSEIDKEKGKTKTYTWTTPEGQRIRLSGRGDMVRLETQAGASIELNGSQIIIQGSRIDFRELKGL